MGESKLPGMQELACHIPLRFAVPPAAVHFIPDYSSHAHPFPIPLTPPDRQGDLPPSSTHQTMDQG
jgi:hypothetical protein